jgi:ketol-acid reductoisomerase
MTDHIETPRERGNIEPARRLFFFLYHPRMEEELKKIFGGTMPEHWQKTESVKNVEAHMPKRMEQNLKREAAEKGLKGKRADRYVYGTMRKSGWKPERERK